MSILILHPTILAEWQALVKEAERHSHQLDEALESYLIFLLERFTKHPEIARRVLANEYLQGMQAHGREQMDQLRDVGDQCLLFAGFFPGRAERKRVRVSYFVDLGQGAYAALSNLNKRKLSELYAELSAGFVTLMDVLQTMRECANETSELKLIEATELWHDTSSTYALKIIRRHTRGMPLRNKSTVKH